MRSLDMYLLIILLLSCLSSNYGARILGIFPTPSISHQQPFQVIMKALVARGHQVTVISPNPQKTPIENYTDVDLSFSYQDLRSAFDFAAMDDIDAIDVMPTFIDFFAEMTDIQISSPQFQDFIRSNNTSFDLVIHEKAHYQAYHGLIHHVGSPPSIGVLSYGGIAVTYSAFGNPFNPSFCPDIMVSFSDRMTFWERAYNLYVHLRLSYLWHFQTLKIQDAIMRKHFGSTPPSVYEAEYNDSLLLLNNHWSLNYPRPLLPNVVELTGLHLKTTREPLPKDIQHFLDQAEHGAIYFSLGSNVMSSTMPKDKLKHILDAFSELPQRVIWKWETDSLPEQPKNVLLGKWFQQQDILAHPNVRAFITQGGLQSFQEAAYHGVPLIGIPFFGDQRHDVEKFVAAKIGVGLIFKELTKNTLLEAVEKVINDTSYRENMKRFSRIYREEVGPSLDRAIQWIEYVLRYNGARHLRSASLDLTWYQYLLLDIFGAALLIVVFSFVISYLVLRKIISLLKEHYIVKKLKTT